MRRMARGAIAVVVVVGTAMVSGAVPGSRAATYDAPAKQVTKSGGHGRGPVALRQATVRQLRDELVVRIRTARAIDVDELRAGTGQGHRICVSVLAPTETRLCLDASGGRLRARSVAVDGTGRAASRWRAVPATIGRPAKRIVQIRAPFASFGASPGRVSWVVRTSWRDGDECRTAGRCEARLPQLGFASYSVRQPVVTGCTASGPTVVTRGRSARKRIALTFDDGPGAQTPRFLDVLRRHDVPATFFVLGRNVGGGRETLRRMIREGHAIGNHSWSHPSLAGGGQGQITSTNDAIRAATGTTPCLFRPPYGAHGPMLDGQLRSLGMLDVLWTVDTNDWQRPGASVIASRVISGARPGAIVLMHDAGGDRGQGLAALPRIITGLKARGYELVTVPQLLGLRERVRYRGA